MSELVAVPNVSEGADAAVLAAIGAAYEAAGARVLDVHADPDHGRAVFTLAAARGTLGAALAAGGLEAVARIDLRAGPGAHPHVGAVDVVPVVFRDTAERGAAVAEALVAAGGLARGGVPVLHYGLLGGGKTRAGLRRGGLDTLSARLAAGELTVDAGPATPAARTGVALVAARAPLVAFNVELAAPAGLAEARAVAARIREGGEDGLPGVRAIGLVLRARGGVAQVSTNVEDHRAVPLARVVAAVAAHAAVVGAEVVGLPPAAAFDGYPSGLPTRGRRTLEDALAAAPATGN